MRRSAVRELLKLTLRPDLISFAGGLPAPELFPVEALAEAARVVLRDRPGAALQYGETEGVGELRDWIAARHSTSSRPLTRENVLIASGAQQGLDLIGRIFLNSGDRVAVQNPTYLALLSAWRPLGVDFVPFYPGNAESDDPAPSWGLRGARFAYVLPEFRNPTGESLTLRERRRFLEDLAASDALAVEDDPYGDLRYSGDELPSLFELEAREFGGEERILRTGTFSKILAPGLRVGWVLAAAPVIDRLTLAKQALDLHTSTMSQHLVLELVRRGVLEGQRERLRGAYRERRDAMLAALEERLPSTVTWTRPEGGMFVFVTLPEGCDTSALLPVAVRHGVAFVPGGEFHVDGTGRNTMRLNFTHAAPERIREGVRRLAEALAEAGVSRER